MNVIDFLNAPALETPMEWTGSNNLVAVIKQRVDCFLELLKSLDFDDLIDKAKLLHSCEHGSENLMQSLTRFLEGKVQESYAKFEAGIRLFEDDMEDSIYELNDIHGIDKNLYFYRLRRTSVARLSWGDLFHIPFEKRHLVASQRFSIPGIPCLYTAGSTYACWEELGRPPFHELHAAVLRPAAGENPRCLDLRWTAKAVKARAFSRGLVNDAAWLAKVLPRMIAIWPLTAMCTIRVKNPVSVFKPEYIIPQMVLQWIASREDVDGVAYASTHIDYSLYRDQHAFSNYAFPSSRISLEGYCKTLQQKFFMSEPIGWALASAMAPSQGCTEMSYPIMLDDNTMNTTFNSSFGIVERVLLRMSSK